jgi:hypothetical protein
MASVLTEVVARLGVGWRMQWGPPPNGVYLLKEVYMAEPEEASAYCREGDLVVVYIVAALEGGLNVVYGRVKPSLFKCPVATFIRRFAKSEARQAVKTLIDFATGVDKVPLFQINPELIRFAGLCDDYPVLCEDLVVVVNKLTAASAKRQRRREAEQPPRPQTWLLDELARILREKMELDASFVEIVKKIIENPERLRECYV